MIPAPAPPPLARGVTLLEVVDLTKRFAGLTALDGVSFTVREGETIGLFGPKGAGKTTCFDCVSGLTVPDRGRVLYDGRPVTAESPHVLARLGIGRTFQVVKPFRDLSALENVFVALGRRQRGLRALGWFGNGASRRQALGLLERVGLAAEAERKAGFLPLGMLKRLELARALALSPRVLLLDEPLAGLDREDTQVVAELIAVLRAQGLTIILAEQGMQAAMALVDRVIILSHGVLIGESTPAAVQGDRRMIEARFGEPPP